MRKLVENIALFLTAAVAVSCAKTVNVTEFESTRQVFESFIHMHYPEVEDHQVGNGIYILEDEAGTGAQVDSGSFIRYNFIIRNLMTGEILSYNKGEVAKQKNEYDASNYYGPQYTMYSKTTTPTIYETINGGGAFKRMKIGGVRTAIVPCWIHNSTTIKNSAEDYLKGQATGTNAMITIELIDTVKNITRFQIDTMETYVRNHYHEVPDTSKSYGFYFMRDKLREQQRGVTVDESAKFPSDTTIYIEYIGRLLNGKVFDTNITDTAIKYGIAKKGAKLNPVAVTWATDSLSLKMSGNSVIKGFSYMLWKMHPYESADAVFTSDWGYGASGSGQKIPPYSPLLFQVNIVDKP